MCGEIIGLIPGHPSRRGADLEEGKAETLPHSKICLCPSITAQRSREWFPSCTVEERKALSEGDHRRSPLSSLEELYSSQYLIEGKSILKHPSHLGHFLFELLPSSRCFRTLKTRTKRFKNSFYAKALTAKNAAGTLQFCEDRELCKLNAWRMQNVLCDVWSMMRVLSSF